MLRRILLRIANEIAYNTGEVTGVITLIVWFLYTRDRVLHDNSPAAFIIFFSIILYLPLFSAVFYILMLIPKLVCMTILLVVDKKIDIDMTELNLTTRNLNVFGKNRIRRMMILNASRKKGRKKKGKTNRPGRTLMSPGRRHMKDIAASRRKVIKRHTIKAVANMSITPPDLKKMSSVMLFHFMDYQCHLHRTS